MSQKKTILFLVLAVLLSVFLSARQAGAREAAANVRATLGERPAVDDCFDVGIRELASCRRASQQLAELQAIRRDDCYDVGLGELADCRRASRRAAQLVRTRLDECFDVSVRELATCRQTLEALSR